MLEMENKHCIIPTITFKTFTMPLLDRFLIGFPYYIFPHFPSLLEDMLKRCLPEGIFNIQMTESMFTNIPITTAIS